MIDDIQKLSEALKKAKKERTSLQDELEGLRKSLIGERRRLKKVIVYWGPGTEEHHLARRALKASTIGEAIEEVEDQASVAVSRAVKKAKAETIEFTGDVVPSSTDRFWVYIRGLYDIGKGQVNYGYAARMTVYRLNLPDDFKVPPKPDWWVFPW